MYSTVGRGRRISGYKVFLVFQWTLERKTARQMAKEVGVCVRTLSTALRPCVADSHGIRPGRPRKLTGERLERLRDWQRKRRTVAQKARELGLTQRQLQHVIAYLGKYKAAPPELRARAVRERRALREQLMRRGAI